MDPSNSGLFIFLWAAVDAALLGYIVWFLKLTFGEKFKG